MTKPTASSSFDSAVRTILDRTVADLSQAIRASIAQEIQSLIGGGGTYVAKATAAPAAKPGAKPAPKAKPGAAKGKTGGRKRGPGVDPALVDKVLAYVKANPDKRTEQISKALKLDAKPALAKLRETKMVKTKGNRRATTYSA